MNDETVYKPIVLVSPKEFRTALAHEDEVEGTGFTMGVYPVKDTGEGNRGYLLFGSRENLEAALDRHIFS